MQRFSSELRDRFPHRIHIFDDYEQEVGEWEFVPFNTTVVMPLAADRPGSLSCVSGDRWL